MGRRLPLAMILAVCAACKSGDGAAPASAGVREATLFFSTEVTGYVEPCGCTSKPLGGIQRLVRVVSDEKTPHAFVDAGNLLFPSEPMTEAARDQHVLKARMLTRVYRQLGVAAMNLGPSDLLGGTDFLRDLQTEGAVPWVSANVRPVGERGPSVAQSFQRDLGGIRVGITGVATPESIGAERSVTALEYAPPLLAEIAGLRKRGAEVVVVLAHVGEREARDLATAVQGADVLIRAPGTPIGHPPAAPERVGNVIIVEAGSQGQHVGKLSLRFPVGPITRPIAFDDGGEQQRQARALGDRKIKALEQEVLSLSADPKNAEAVQARKAQIVELAARNAARAPGEGSFTAGLKVELIPLTEDLKPDANATELLTAYYAQLRSMNAKKGDQQLCQLPTGSAEQRYVGSEACQPCHAPAYDFWAKTKHGRAWATLEDQGKHFDLTCIGCHSVGYQTPGGYCRLDDLGVLKNVGCEMCHGPGSLHVVTGDKKQTRRTVTEATCAASCHVPAHSDTFAYKAYLARITGEGHRLGSPP